MKKFEYKMLYYQDRHEAEEAMNEYADLGWKLDKFEVTYAGGYTTSEFYVVLKREAQRQPTTGDPEGLLPSTPRKGL